MKKIYTLLFLGIITYNLHAQAPSIEWQKCLGGENNESGVITLTLDGGYIVAGYSESNDGNVIGNHGNSDVWVVKLDALGNTSWQKCLGGSNYDGANAVIQCRDSGYVVVGASESNDADVSGNHGGFDFWVVKLDALGNVSWQKSLGGSAFDAANSIIQTTEGGYVVVGVSESNNGDISGNHGNYDAWIVKLDELGNISWQKSLGGSAFDAVYSIIQKQVGGYVVAGYTYSNNGDVNGNNGAHDFWIIELDTLGNISWQKCLGGGDHENAFSILSIDGGYVVSGTSNSIDGNLNENHGGFDFWIVNIDTLGGIVWQKSLGGLENDEAFSIKQTQEGGYIVAGYSESNDGNVSGNHGEADCWIVKLDKLGNIVWQKSLGGTSIEIAYSINPTQDGGYVIAGYSDSNNGDVTGNHGNSDYWIIKLAPDSTIINQIPENQIFSMVTLYPNPAGEVLNIDYVPNLKITAHTYTVFDLQGKQLQTGVLQIGKNALNIAELPAGHYMIQTPAGTQAFEVLR